MNAARDAGFLDGIPRMDARFKIADQQGYKRYLQRPRDLLDVWRASGTELWMGNNRTSAHGSVHSYIAAHMIKIKKRRTASPVPSRGELQ